MSTQDGDPSPSDSDATTGNASGAHPVFAGTIILVAVAVPTFPVPGTPSLSEMDEATASAPRVIVDCQTTWVGNVVSEACYWTLRLDDGKELAWPGEKSKGQSGYVREYLRANGPITVRFWNGRLYQIELHDGDLYLAYGDTYRSDQQQQWTGVILGFLVSAISLVRIGLELRYLHDPIEATRAGELGSYLSFVCVGGALLVAIAGTHRMWTGVVGLALFAALAPTFDQKCIRRVQEGALERSE